jgi:hypothetical protein
MLDVNNLLNKLILVARDDRASKPYSSDESFVPKVLLIGPYDETTVIPIGWRNEADKYAKLEIVADAARRTLSQAIVLISDTRWLQSNAFCEHFKIDPPRSTEPADVEEFQKRYLAILSQHDGQIKNLPRHLWSEAVMVAIKGPMCGTHSLLAPYTQGPGDKVRYLPREDQPFRKDSQTWKEKMNIIPDWWV